MDLSNPSDWAGPYQYDRPSSNAPILIPLAFSSQIIAAAITTTGGKDTWYTGGWLRQTLSIDLSDASKWIAYSQRVKLGANVIVFPNNYSSYNLEFSFPEWFSNGQISIWAYKGVSDPQVVSNDLDNLQKSLTSIQTALQIIQTFLGIVG